MKVLLVSTNRLGPSEACPWVPVEPLGLMYVAASTRGAGHDVSFLDLCFDRDPAGTVRAAIKEHDPDAIGLSFRNIEMMAYFNNTSFLGDLLAVVDACREQSDAPVILGGSGFSVMPVELMKRSGADIGIVGEGERSFPRVLSALERGAPLAGIPGAVHVERDELRINPCEYAPDLADLPAPDRGLIDHGRYIAAGGRMNIQTKRGCPFTCTYCTYPLVEGARPRCRPARDVAAELRFMHERFGIGEAYFVDSQFNHPVDHAKAVCAELLAMRDEVKVRWTCMLNPWHLDDDLVFLMRAARCATVDFGIESASDAVLRGLRKDYTREDIERAIALLRKYKLPFDTWILLGGPGETEETVRETVEFLIRLDVPRVLFSVAIRICPGTSIERMMRDRGAIAPGHDFLEPIYHCTPDADTIAGIVAPHCREREGWQIAAFGNPDTTQDESQTITCR